ETRGEAQACCESEIPSIENRQGETGEQGEAKGQSEAEGQVEGGQTKGPEGGKAATRETQGEAGPAQGDITQGRPQDEAATRTQAGGQETYAGEESGETPHAPLTIIATERIPPWLQVLINSSVKSVSSRFSPSRKAGCPATAGN